MYERTSINNCQYTGWFKLHILLNFIYMHKNIVFRCTIPLTYIDYNALHVFPRTCRCSIKDRFCKVNNYVVWSY